MVFVFLNYGNCVIQRILNMASKFLSVKVPQDIDAILLGAGLMYSLLCLPVVGNMVAKSANFVRTKLGGTAL